MQVELNQTDINVIVARFAVGTPVRSVNLTDNNIIAVKASFSKWFVTVSPTINIKVTCSNGNIAFKIDNISHIPFLGKVAESVFAYLNKLPFVREQSGNFVLKLHEIPNVDFFRRVNIHFTGIEVAFGKMNIHFRAE